MTQKRVAIIGVAYTKFDEHWDKSLRDLATEAGSIFMRPNQRTKGAI